MNKKKRTTKDAQTVKEQKTLKEQWWKVEEGTGMGMTMSGAIADAALYNLIEMNWICLLYTSPSPRDRG